MEYDELTDEEFDEILTEIIDEHSGSSLLAITGVYEVLKEEFNNQVLDRWAAKQVKEDDEE